MKQQKNNIMKATFTKLEFNTEVIKEETYVTMFEKMGFSPSRVEICFTNGCSVYVSLNVKVLKEGQMYADVFVYDGVASIKVRISDHDSNLERICGGVSGNKMSFMAFSHLVENNVITQ
jgi:hypothetical protein